MFRNPLSILFSSVGVFIFLAGLAMQIRMLYFPERAYPTFAFVLMMLLGILIISAAWVTDKIHTRLNALSRRDDHSRGFSDTPAATK